MNGYLVAAIILLMVGHIFKSLRWKQIIGAYEDVSSATLLRLMGVSQGLNLVLPFRLGDVVRIGILGKRHLKNGYVLAIASVVADLLIDIITVGMAFVMLYLLGIHADEVKSMALSYGLFSLFAMILCCTVILNKKLVKKWVQRISAVFNERIEGSLLLTSYTFFSSLKNLLCKKKLVRVFLFTVGTWCSYFLSYGAFALFLQGKQFGFTLTRVFKAVFSMTGNSLLQECLKGQAGTQWSVWFLIYLMTPLFLIGLITLIATQLRKKSGSYGAKSRNILPQLRANERLAFLNIYFNSEGSDYINAYLEINKDVNVIQDYSAGSNATTILCVKDDTIFFRKYAFGADAISLWAQMNWLQQYAQLLPLAKVIDQCRTEHYAYYDMQYANEANSFFRFMHASSTEESWDVLRSILKTMEENLYCRQRRRCDMAELGCYISDKVQKNLLVCESWAAAKHKGLWQAEKVYINGVPYNNLRHYRPMLSEANLQAVFGQDPCAEIHGDLTLENIICSRNGAKTDWYLIDSNNGQMHESPYLDLSKLLQSLHGRYEFLRMVDRVQLKDNCITFLNTYSTAYRALYKQYRAYLERHYSAAARKSIFYHEIVHWLRLMPYKIRNNPETAAVFYAGMLIVLADVEQEFGNGC